MSLPILYTLEHSSADLGSFFERVSLTEEELIRFSDFGVRMTVPTHTKSVIADLSRALIDLNRAPDSPELYPTHDFSKPVPKAIWKPGRSPRDNEKRDLFSRIYEPYHSKILRAVREFDGPGIVAAWHNTAHYVIGKNDKGEEQMMVPFILSNLGDEGSAASKTTTTTCSPRLLMTLASILSKELKKNGLPHDIALNLVFKGGYTTEHYNTIRHPELGLAHELHAIQVEYDTSLTHNQETLEPNERATIEIRKAFENAIEKTYEDYFGNF